MTMFKPNIQVSRLHVTGAGRVVYDEKFHPGMNIIRGENSSGKSTIMDFLFYGLGGDLTSWREAALKCDVIFLEVFLNGFVATLSREVNEQSNRPMKIFLGAMDEALAAASEGWEIYPYKRGKKYSFSQVLFRYLKLPEVQYEESETKITMNQILRLVYADQLSPVEKLFKVQNFDDPTTRQTVGDLLCGAFSERFYRAKLRLAETRKEFSDFQVKINALSQSFVNEDHPLTEDWLASQQASYEKQLEETYKEIEAVEAKIFHGQFDDRLSLNDQEETYNQLVRVQADLARIREEIDRLEIEKADSENFLADLHEKIESLQEADQVISEFQGVEYDICPSCLHAIDIHEVEGACGLCQRPFDHEETKARSLKLIREYALQLEQSEQLQKIRDDKLAKLRGEFAKAHALWKEAQGHYSIAVKTPTTELRVRLRDLNRHAGYLARQIEDLANKAEIIKRLSDLYNEKAQLQKEIDELGQVLAQENQRNLVQISKAYKKISEFIIDFLKNDLARQSTFENAREVKFEFDSDRMSVNGDSFFSASSMVYLKNSFFASFLFAAVDDNSFNHPRLLIMDTVEDKGMEPERSQNFQRLLFKYSESAHSDHQIIIATSMIADELDKDGITVGSRYTHDNRTLRVG